MVRFLTGRGGREEEGGIEPREGSVASDPGVVAEGTTARDSVGVAESLREGRLQKASNAGMDGIVACLIGGVGV